MEAMHVNAAADVAGQFQADGRGTSALQVVSFAGDLLSGAEGLLRDGLHTSEVADGYAKAAAEVITTCGLAHGCTPANAPA